MGCLEATCGLTPRARLPSWRAPGADSVGRTRPRRPDAACWLRAPSASRRASNATRLAPAARCGQLSRTA
eukprot:192086-Alexandrium_andersonii.AAC.1